MKILLADDHAIFRAGLQLTLGNMQSGMQVHSSHDLVSLLSLIDAHPDVDVVVVDLHMPGMDGCSGLSRLRDRLRKTPILVLSASDDPDDVYGCLAAGASGYVHKGAPGQAVNDAIRTVCAGGVYLPRDLLAHEAAKAGKEAQIGLSPRQQQVFDLLVEGFPNKRIAYDLGMTEGTVKAHVSSIMRRFGASNRVQLLRAVEREGLLRKTPKGRI